MRKHKLRKQKF